MRTAYRRSASGLSLIAGLRTALAASMVILAACSGGAATMKASSGASMLSVGTITGFGTVHLNGQVFQTTAARITVNGQVATQADLRVGEVVQVTGHHDDASNTDVADDIEYHDSVQGPVSSIDLTGQKVVVLGQTVLVSTDTSFGAGITPASLAGIAVGDILEVSGMPTSSGDIQASRVEREPAGSPFRVTGAASATDGMAKHLMINALLVDFSAAQLVGFMASGPKDGDRVEASGTTLGSAGELQATKLELRGGDDFSGDADDNVELEGLVTRFASATDFDVSGHGVTTTSTTTYVGGMSTDLALNARIEVEGTVNTAGVLVATKVRFEPASATELVGQADAVDTVNGTVTVLGIPVSITSMTRFEDQSDEGVSTFSLADVHTGDWLKIRGDESPAGSNMLVATRLERIGMQSGVRIAGTVKTATSPNFTILSVNIATTPTTDFRSLSSTTFFMNLVGQLVWVKGSWDGTTLTATQASFGEDEED